MARTDSRELLRWFGKQSIIYVKTVFLSPARKMMLAFFKGGQCALKQLMQLRQGFVHGAGKVEGQTEDAGVERTLSEKS